VDWDLASFQIGGAVDASFLERFDGRIQRLESGRYWISGFIEFQYGKLSLECRPHGKVIDVIKTRNIPYQIPYSKGIGYPQEEEEEEEGTSGVASGKDKSKNKHSSSPRGTTKPIRYWAIGDAWEASARLDMSLPMPEYLATFSEWWRCTPEEYRARLCTQYSVDDQSVLAEHFKNMALWLETNFERRKTDVLKFARNWLGRAKNPNRIMTVNQDA
jgi:hypothetical protein